MTSLVRIIGLIYIVTYVLNVSAQSSDEEDLSFAFGDEDFISIATGRNQPIVRAPAVASVITANDIKAMGATDLDQILESVPGLHVSNSGGTLNPIYIIRGIYSDTNPQVLFLINGIPITNLFLGDRSQVWAGMPVGNISRVEVIRGPGSAVFGADAFAGVVNIITKSASEINGAEFGIRAGSFDTKDAWMLYGKNVHSFDIAFSLQLHKTDGYKEIIDADAQTGFDALFGTNASLAPGAVNT